MPSTAAVARAQNGWHLEAHGLPTAMCWQETLEISIQEVQFAVTGGAEKRVRRGHKLSAVSRILMSPG
ncbi:unnamed protein product, partial [Iphiclides podalirius]